MSVPSRPGRAAHAPSGGLPATHAVGRGTYLDVAVVLREDPEEGLGEAADGRGGVQPRVGGTKADPGGVETLDDLAQVGQPVADLLGRGDEEQVEAALRRVVERAREPATTVYRRCPMVAVGLD